jgi:hypothetical protein
MSWDGRGRNGLLEPGGVYLARLRSEAQVATRKFVLLTH